MAENEISVVNNNLPDKGIYKDRVVETDPEYAELINNKEGRRISPEELCEYLRHRQENLAEELTKEAVKVQAMTEILQQCQQSHSAIKRKYRKVYTDYEKLDRMLRNERMAENQAILQRAHDKAQAKFEDLNNG